MVVKVLVSILLQMRILKYLELPLLQAIQQEKNLYYFFCNSSCYFSFFSPETQSSFALSRTAIRSLSGKPFSADFSSIVWLSVFLISIFRISSRSSCSCIKVLRSADFQSSVCNFFINFATHLGSFTTFLLTLQLIAKISQLFYKLCNFYRKFLNRHKTDQICAADEAAGQTAHDLKMTR